MMYKKIKDNWLLVLVLCLIGVVSLFYIHEKRGMFLDEIYSYGLSNSQNKPFITDVQDKDITEKVITKKELFDYVAVNNKDAFDYKSVYNNQTKDVHPPLFYMTLHTFSSVFRNSFSKYIGLSLNMILFFITLIVLYKTVDKLFKSKELSILGVVLYGFSTLGLSSMLMIRMYMMLTFFTTIFVYLITNLLEDEKKDNYLTYFLIMITILFGTLTQYYFIFYAFFVCLGYDIYLLLKKDYKKFFKFSIFALLGVVLVYLIFPACINHVFRKGSVSGSGILGRLADFGNYPKALYDFSSLLIKYFSVQIILILLLVTIILISIIKKNKYNKVEKKDLKLNALIIIVPSVFTFILVSLISPYVSARYFYNIVPVFSIMIIYLIYILNKKINIKKINYIYIVISIVVIIMSFVIKPEWLYKEQQPVIDIARAIGNSPSIYITKNNNPAITQDLIFLVNLKSAYVTKNEDSKKLDEYIRKNRKEKQPVMVFISHFEEQHDNEKILNKLKDRYGFSSFGPLYGGFYSDIYLLNP